ncbi:DUF2971 domain-containing protein [Alteromonas sp. ZYF713]|nr:DUF2971 domain-containing protein [Alteromonas sp. ZYF713]
MAVDVLVERITSQGYRSLRSLHALWALRIKMDLFHYTSLDTALNIISNNELWVSNVHFMNDSSELGAGFSIVADAWFETLNTKGGEQEAKANLINYIRENKDHYVFSLSKNGDQLSQWRGYANFGKGCCIGFDKDVLEEFCKNISKNREHLYELEFLENYDNIYSCDLVECIYTDDVQVQREAYDIGYRMAKTSPKDSILQQKNIKEAVDFSLSVKDKGFKEEAEYRLVLDLITSDFPPVANRDSNKDFRVANGRIIPFYRLRLPDKCITSVRLGPDCEKINNKLGLDKVLETLYNSSKVKRKLEILESAITYKN